MDAETLAIIGTVLAVGVGLAGWLMHCVGRIARVEDRQIDQGERFVRLDGALDRFDRVPAPAGY